MGNISNVKIGDVEVYIDYSDGNGEQYLGHTKGGVIFTFEREFEELTVDQYGSAPVEMALTGQNLMIKAYLAEVTNENVSHAAPEGTFAGTGSNSKVGFGKDAGYLMSNSAVALRLHPKSELPSARNSDVYLHRAVSVENVELPFKIDEQRILEVTWKALVDEDQPDGQRLGRIGDPDVS